jgi:hypothetical protein
MGRAFSPHCMIAQIHGAMPQAGIKRPFRPWNGARGKSQAICFFEAGRRLYFSKAMAPALHTTGLRQSHATISQTTGGIPGTLRLLGFELFRGVEFQEAAGDTTVGADGESVVHVDFEAANPGFAGFSLMKIALSGAA